MPATVRQLSRLLFQACLILMVVASLLTAGLIVYSRQQGLQLLSVQTGSMRPRIQPGDAVIVRQSQRLPQVGQVVSYHSLKDQSVIVTHRVVAVDPVSQQLTTKGDALATPDPAFKPERLVGVAERSLPKVGYGLDFIRRPAGLAAAVYAPGILLSVWEIRRLSAVYRHQHYVAAVPVE